MLLYHIGAHRPTPRPMVQYDHRISCSSGVFLTPEWRPVARYFGGRFSTSKKCRIYKFDVPRSVIRRSGGFRRYDSATEIVIPAELWKEVKFLGSEEVPTRRPGKDRRDKIAHARDEKLKGDVRAHLAQGIARQFRLSVKEAYRKMDAKFPSRGIMLYVHSERKAYLKSIGQGIYKFFPDMD